jgi:hypothetical protein
MVSRTSSECFCGCGRRLRVVDRRKRFNRAGRRVDAELQSLREVYELMETGGEGDSEVGVELESFLEDGARFRHEILEVVHGERKPRRAERRKIRGWTGLVREHSLRVREAIKRSAGTNGASG